MSVEEDANKQILYLMGIENTPFNRGQLQVFRDCMKISAERNIKYGNLWERYGWLGNLLHVQSKAARVAKMYWEDRKQPDDDLDDAFDLINYTTFFIRNAWANNERGAN